MDECTAVKGGRRLWDFDGDLDHLTWIYVERPLGGALAAALTRWDDAVIVQFDPVVMRERARHHLRSWARRHVANGWLCAAATAADIAPLLT